MTHSPQLFAYDSREELGRNAARRAATTLRAAIETREHARLMLASAPSQYDTLRSLVMEPDIDWSKVEAFHMDEYVGLARNASQGFGNWLQALVFDKIVEATFRRIMVIDGRADICARSYQDLMGESPFDLVLLGIGVNGHLAFNDPPADFGDPSACHVVELDEASRQQQVDEGHFAAIDHVPSHAITVTIPRLLNAEEIIALVPGIEKRAAVRNTLLSPIDGNVPATALRTHPRVSIYVDSASDPR